MSIVIRVEEPRTLEEAMARKNIPRLKDLATRVGCSPRSLTGWLSGAHQPSAYYLGQLSRVLDTDVRRFISAEGPHPAVLSRRTFVAGTTALIGTTFLPLTLPLARPVSSGVPQAVISSLAAITQQYRTMQRNGLAGIEEGLRGHVATIQGALEATSDDRRRRDLWRVLAEAQLLLRLNITKESELGRAKTWNEAAIASAQQGGDHGLVAATIGHLAHLYLMWQHDATVAEELLSHARQVADERSPLAGWLHLITAATAAKAGDRECCISSIDKAEALADRAGQSSATDPFFTDFDPVSVQAFAGNSLITVGAYREAHGMLTSMDLGQLAHNRHASAFYDVSRAYLQEGEFEAAKVYAFQAIDSAVATNRLYIVPRFLTVCTDVRAADRKNPYLHEIAEYAQHVLQYR